MIAQNERKMLIIIKALPTIVPVVTGPFNSFLKPSQLPWEYTACAAKYVANYMYLLTRTISVLTGTNLPMGVEKQV